MLSLPAGGGPITGGRTSHLPSPRATWRGFPLPERAGEDGLPWAGGRTYRKPLPPPFPCARVVRSNLPTERVLNDARFSSGVTRRALQRRPLSLQ